jgi:hypothetical protein
MKNLFLGILAISTLGSFSMLANEASQPKEWVCHLNQPSREGGLDVSILADAAAKLVATLTPYVDGSPSQGINFRVVGVPYNRQVSYRDIETDGRKFAVIVYFSKPVKGSPGSYDSDLIYSGVKYAMVCGDAPL